MMDIEATRRPSRQRVLRIMGFSAVGAGGLMLAAWDVTGWTGVDELGLWLVIMGVFWLAVSLFASRDPLRPAHVRHLREFIPAIIVYMVLVFAFKPLLARVDEPVFRTLIALMPVVPMVFVVRAMVRKLIDGDELERRMQLEAVSIASISVGLLSFAAAFLGVAGVLHLEHPLMMILPALFVAYALALLWIRRRYQGP